MAILQLAQISKRFGAVVAAEAVDLELAEGEALGIIGPNGAGKTTLFNLIAGTARQDSGTIQFLGRDISAVGAAQRCRMGLSRSFQIPHPFSGMTVFENVLVGAAFGADQRERQAYPRVVEILRITDLAEKANSVAGKLTLLERKRLELARALATEPRVLMLDEIAGGLTEHECRDLVASIRQIRETGISIIWIEHIVHALIAVVDRLAVINFGRKIADGDPRRLIDSPEVRDIYMGVEAHA